MGQQADGTMGASTALFHPTRPSNHLESIMTFKTILFFLFSISPVALLAQETTYSLYEERMLQYVNNRNAYAHKYDSLDIIPAALDSCKKFLVAFPRSFAKPGVFAYMLQMTAKITKDREQIFPLIDSVLFYDHLPSTKYGIGELLIEEKIDAEKGRLFLIEAYPQLTVNYHRFKSNLLFARVALSEGDLSSAQLFFQKAVAQDSSRFEAWYEYASFLKYTEQTNELAKVVGQIELLEKNGLLRYERNSDESPNINKTVTHFSLSDLRGTPVKFNQFLGEPLIVQNFNFWCGIPQNAMPILKKLTKEFPRAKVIFVNEGDTKEELLNRFLNKPEYKFLKASMIVFADSTFYSYLSRQTARTIYIVDKKGKIRAEYQGYNKGTEEILRGYLELLNKE